MAPSKAVTCQYGLDILILTCGRYATVTEQRAISPIGHPGDTRRDSCAQLHRGCGSSSWGHDSDSIYHAAAMTPYTEALRMDTSAPTPQPSFAVSVRSEQLDLAIIIQGMSTEMKLVCVRRFGSSRCSWTRPQTLAHL